MNTRPNRVTKKMVIYTGIGLAREEREGRRTLQTVCDGMSKDFGGP